jgi:Zn finger protein HypA/HybF involved in hydrogenase expression
MVRLPLDRGDHQRETYSRGAGGMPSGETVTPGTYRCRDCDYELEVEEEKVTNLPVCPRCQCELWELA